MEFNEVITPRPRPFQDFCIACSLGQKHEQLISALVDIKYEISELQSKHHLREEPEERTFQSPSHKEPKTKKMKKMKFWGFGLDEVGARNMNAKTPKEILDELEAEFGPLTDMCPENHTIDSLAASTPWTKMNYLNPPLQQCGSFHHQSSSGSGKRQHKHISDSCTHFIQVLA
jgi:hypothetical protein